MAVSTKHLKLFKAVVPTLFFALEFIRLAIRRLLLQLCVFFFHKSGISSM